MNSDEKFKFNEGDTLVYKSDSLEKKFSVIKIIHGQYEDSRTGTCSKTPKDIYEFQAIYMKSIDSSSIPKYYIRTINDDCSGSPSLSNDLIDILNYNLKYSKSKINWYHDLSSLESNYTNSNKEKVLNNTKYQNVFEYAASKDNTDSVEVFYYNRKLGFVGFKLKNGRVFNLINK